MVLNLSVTQTISSIDHIELQRHCSCVYEVTLSGVRNIEMSIRFSLKSRPFEQFHRPELSQIKAEISLRTNVKLIFDKNVGLQ